MESFQKATLRIDISFSARHHARRSPSTGCHTHGSHSHASTPGSSPLHGPNAVAGLLSPHRAPPTSHLGQTATPHRLSTVATTAGNGNPVSPPVAAPAPALANVGIEINDAQQGKLSRKRYSVYYSITRVECDEDEVKAEAGKMVER